MPIADYFPPGVTDIKSLALPNFKKPGNKFHEQFFYEYAPYAIELKDKLKKGEEVHLEFTDRLMFHQDTWGKPYAINEGYKPGTVIRIANIQIGIAYPIIMGGIPEDYNPMSVGQTTHMYQLWEFKLPEEYENEKKQFEVIKQAVKKDPSLKQYFQDYL